MRQLLFMISFYNGLSIAADFDLAAALVHLRTTNRMAFDKVFFDAVAKNNLQAITILLDSGANPNATNKRGDTALMLAATYGHEEIAQRLLEKSADPNVANKYGLTALMHAARYGHANVAKRLLEKGAGPNATNKYGDTALMHAVSYGHTETAQRLLEKGADPDAANEQGTTALMLAIRYGHAEVAKLLETAISPERRKAVEVPLAQLRTALKLD
jgi:ankyrin repeat protein